MSGEERKQKINQLISRFDEVEMLVSTILPEAGFVLMPVIGTGVITQGLRDFAERVVSDDQVERYQFLRMILNASDLDAVTDTVLSEVETGLQIGEMP